MPKLPRISGSDCIAVLHRMGFVTVRQRGSHVVMRCGDCGCVVPLHREVKVGTLRGLLKQGGIEPDKFIETYYR